MAIGYSNIDALDTRPQALRLNDIATTRIGSKKNYVTQTQTNIPIVKGDAVIAKNFTYKRRFS